MPAYMIRSAAGPSSDTLIEDPALTLTFSGDWAIFSDAAGTYLAVSASQARSIERVDEPMDEPPAPATEG